MKRMRVTLWSVALSSLISAFEFQGKAIVPTSRGQIGINPVDPVTTTIIATDAISIDLEATGDPSANIGSIGDNTQLLTEDGGTTSWIGKNTAYLTEVIRTATVSGTETTATRFPSMQIVGPVDDDGIPTGAFDFIVSPMLLEQIQDLADTLCNDESTCAADFPPRVEALLKSGGDTLTKRGGEVAVVELGIIATAAVTTVFIYLKKIVKTYWNTASQRRPIPHVLHVEPAQGTAPSPTNVIATSFAMTAKVMPTSEAATNDNDDKYEQCWKYVGVEVGPQDSDTLDESSDSEESSTPNKRSIAGRISLNGIFPLSTRGLSKRAKLKKITQIGNCAVKPDAEIIRAQNYPSASKAMLPFDIQANGVNSGLDPNLYWFVPDQGVRDFDDACVIAKLIQKGKRDPANPSIKSDNFPLPYDQSGEIRTLSVDHIFETSTLDQFFQSVLKDPNDPRCKPFVEMFDKPDSGLEAGQRSRFFSLWSQQSNPFPGNWALAGADQRVNNFKGYMLNPKTASFTEPEDIQEPNSDAKFDKLFQIWNNAGLSMGFINNRNVAAYFAARTAKVYAAFRDFDEIQKCEKDPQDTTPSTSWAEEFKQYMINLLKENEDMIQQRITDLKRRIENQQSRLKKPNSYESTKYGKAFQQLNNIYPVDRFKFDTGLLLSFPEAPLGIRDATPTDACHKPEETVACWEKILVNCHYEYKERPDLAIEDCPPTPAWPITCGGRRDDENLPADPSPPPPPPPPPAPSLQPPTLGTYGCYDQSSHSDITEGVVRGNANDICSKVWNQGDKVTMDANTIAKTYNPKYWYTASNIYWYGVGWIKGCQTTSDTQSVGDPLGDGNAENACATLLFNSYKNCLNGGTGGWVDAGCLRYTFRASRDGLTTDWADVVKTE